MEENPNPQRPHLNSKWVPLLFDPQNSQNSYFNPTEATLLRFLYYLYKERKKNFTIFLHNVLPNIINYSSHSKKFGVVGQKGKNTNIEGRTYMRILKYIGFFLNFSGDNCPPLSFSYMHPPMCIHMHMHIQFILQSLIL